MSERSGQAGSGSGERNSAFEQLAREQLVARCRDLEMMLAQYESLVSSQGGGIGIVDLDERFSFANPAAEHIFGVPPGQLVGRRLDEFLGEDSWQVVSEQSAKRRLGKGSAYDLQIERPDGSCRWISVSAVPRTDEDGAVIGTYGIFSDVTRRVSAENSIRQSEAMLRAVIESTGDGILVIDGQSRLLHWNQRLAALWGESPASLADRDGTALLIRVSRRTREPAAFLRRIRAVINSEEESLDVVDFSDGRTLEVLSRPLIMEGVPAGRVWSCRDNTEKRQLEEQARRERANLVDARREALAASMAKSEFLANMSHEVRTPLNGVIGLTEIVLRGDLEDSVRARLMMVKTSADSLLTLVDDILDFARMDVGEIRLRSEEFMIRPLIDQVAAMGRVRREGDGPQIRVEVDRAVPKLLTGDPHRLQQVLGNLVDNAVKFTAQGEIVIRVERDVDAEGAPGCRFSVSDTGIGIGQKDQARVFEAFVQVDGSSTRQCGGTGLGLAISARLTDLMGGRLVLSSAFGQGSTFCFFLPLRQELPGWQCDEKKSSTDPMAPSLEPIAPAEVGLRLLLAEDNEVNRRITLNMLEPRGHRVTVVEDGQAALHRVIGERFDAVILDVQMPEMDGLQVARAIRRLPRLDRRSVPILTVTAHAQPGDQQKCLDAGVNAYLAKPFSAESLYTLVERIAAGQPVLSRAPAPHRHSDRVLDLDDLRRRTRGNAALIRELVELFESRAPALLAEMEQAISANDAEALCRSAHGLKGSAAMLAAHGVHEKALEIESMGRQGRADQAVDVLPELRDRIEQLRLLLGEL